MVKSEPGSTHPITLNLLIYTGMYTFLSEGSVETPKTVLMYDVLYDFDGNVPTVAFMSSFLLLLLLIFGSRGLEME